MLICWRCPVSERENDKRAQDITPDNEKRSRSEIKSKSVKKPKPKGMTFKKWVLLSVGVILLAGLIYVGRIIYIASAAPQKAFKTMGESSPVPTVNSPTPTPKPGETPAPPTPTPDPADLLRQQADSDMLNADRVNILLLGVDRSPERVVSDRDDFRTDVMLLLTIDFANQKVDLISVPRDTYAKIYNVNSRWKINAAFFHGGGFKGEGFEYSMHTISELFGGIPVEYYACVEMDGIKKVVDAMGGVDYDVDVEIRLNGRHLKKGQQHLNGQQVLDYCRARKGISTDVGRIDRQQRILFAVFNQMKSSKQLINIPNIYLSVKDHVYTNLNIEQIAALALFAIENDIEKEMGRHTLKGEYMAAYNASYYVLDQGKKVALIKEIFGINVEKDTKYDLAYVKRDSSASSGQSVLSRAKSMAQSSSYDAAYISQLKAAIARLEALLKKEQATASEITVAINALNALMAAPVMATPTPSPTPTPTPPPPPTTKPTTPPTPTPTTKPTPTPTPTPPPVTPTPTPTPPPVTPTPPPATPTPPPATPTPPDGD
jgi:LCP family protein required for cell wall assembly